MRNLFRSFDAFTRFVVVFTLLLVSTAAFGGTLNVTWTNPTTRTDNTPLTNLASIKIYYGTSASSLMQSKVVPVPATSTTIDVAPGTWYVAATAIDATGLESARTSTVSAVVPVAPPSPPTGLSTTGTVAFNIIKQQNRFVLLPVGTVPAGVACDTSQGVNGHYVVPRDQVSWYGTVRPLVVVALCG
jgi:hypothetical protein